jgi:putative ABC transport system permease protein
VSWIPDRYRELRSRLRPERLEDDVDEELAFHLRQRAADLETDGLPPDVAWDEALRRFGNVTQFREEMLAIDTSVLKERRRMEVFDSIRRETRYSLRALARAPVFTIVAVLTLGAGIGATTSIFTLIDSIVLRPLPYPDQDRLVQLRHAVPGVNEGDTWGNSVASYFHYLDNNRTLEAQGAYSTSVYNLALEGGAERVTGASVTPSLFDVLGIRAERGRLFTDDDVYEGAEPIAVIGWELWQTQYGGDPGIVGRTVQINSVPVTVIGVVPAGTSLPITGHTTNVWRPFFLNRSQPAVNSHWVGTYAKLLPGVTPEGAQADIQRLTAELPEIFPGAYGAAFMETSGFRADVITVRELVLGGVDRILWLLLGAVALVLLIACANVANLLLVRAEARRREQTVRAAMGAERAHFAMHYLTESLLLAIAAGAFGVLLAFGALKVMVATAPATLPRLDQVALSGTGLMFALILALATGLVFGIVPALRSHTNFDELRESGRGMTTSRKRRLVHGTLVVAQVGVAVVLLAAGGLMLQSFMNLRNVDSGIDEQNVLTFQIFMPGSRYPTYQELYNFEQEFARGIRALPGVETVGTTTMLPLSGAGGCSYTVAENQVFGPGVEPPCLATIFIMPGYFEAMRIPVQGDVFTASDVERRTGGVVVSRALAERTWPGEDPIGKGIISYQDGPPWYRVIGVADDVRARGLDQPPEEAVYYPVLSIEGAQQIGPFRGPTYVVRTASADPMQLREPIRQLLVSMDPEVPMANPRTMEEVVMTSPTMARATFTMTLLGISAAMALFLSAVGLYGVIAYLVGRRRAEIGVRMALGARVTEVARLVVLQSVRLTAVGIVVGVGVALLSTRVLASLLFEVQPADPLTLMMVSALLLLVAVLASAIPAHRAARTDPSEALRAD